MSGTTGWAIPRLIADAFPVEGTGLTRYASRFAAVEINSTFYRRHKPETLVRWAAETPESFKFAIKAPRQITHEARLNDCNEALRTFFDDVAPLGEKLGPILIQLPPSLKFDTTLATTFLRAIHSGPVACEPRHETWFEEAADDLLRAHRVARVAADPARHAQGLQPGGWPGFTYWRLHGSPRMYYSPYSDQQLETLAAQVAQTPAPSWCVFDNTASGAAANDALRLTAMVGALRERGAPLQAPERFNSSRVR